jgi:hypothetical protein
MSSFVDTPVVKPSTRPPATVIIAVVLIVLFGLFSLCTAIFMVSGRFPGDETQTVLVVAAVTLGVKAVIALALAPFIWRGVAAAQLIYAIFAALALLMALPAIGRALPVMPALQAVCAALLFLPTSSRGVSRPSAAQPAIMPALPVGDIAAPADRTRPMAMQVGIGMMFVVLALWLWCGGTEISAWVASWPQDDSALADMLLMVPVALYALGDIVMTFVLAWLIWTGAGSARWVFLCMTAVGCRAVIGDLSTNLAPMLLLFATALMCFMSLFLPASNKWLRAGLR